MGWTVLNRYSSQGLNAKEFLDKEMSWDNKANGTSGVIIKSRMVGSVYYAAMLRKNPKLPPEGVIHALVVLTSRKGGEFGYKDMDEGMGPNESRCPASILTLLSPTDNQFALDWRARCRANAAKKPLKVGQTIKFSEPLSFGRFGQYDTFKVIPDPQGKKVARFVPVGASFVCQITRLAQREYAVL